MDSFSGQAPALASLLLHGLGLGLNEHRAQGSGHDVLAALGDLHQEVGGKDYAAPLSAAALAAAGDRLLEAGMGVADHELHACEPAFSSI